MNTSDALRIAASRSAQDPKFLGHVLKLYCQAEGLSEDDLADRLGTDAAFLPRLYLCKRPPSETSDFADRVNAIADYAVIEAATLAAIIRQVDAIESLSRSPNSAGLLAAARDDEDPNDDKSQNNEKDS
jgi:transcriptional regulator with XRE-family HTH domain